MTGTSANPFGFTGHEHDGETGLIYAKARFYDPEVGLFLSEDPADGDLTNPPSLHSYLYAFQNPTVFVDPDGRTAIGDAIEDRLKAGGIDNAAELAGQVQDEFGTVAGVAAGVVLGILGAAAEATAGVVGVVDTAVNAVVAGVAPDSSLGQAAAEELNDTISSTQETVKLIVENRREIGAAIVDGVVETAKGVARGDARAIARATAAVATLVAPGGKTKGIKDAAGAVASRVARSAVASKVARSAGKAKEVVKRNALRATTKVTRRGKRAAASAARGARAAGAKAKAVAGRIAARLGKKGKGVDGPQCFVAGTLVATSTGLRPIEEIEVGDLVWARNEVTGEMRLQRVVQLFVTPDQVVYDVDVEAEDGSVETLTATGEHPFQVKDEGWVGAARLESGDELVSERDASLRVRQVRGSPERQTVYNFEVAVDHTYFVGASGVWVHNECETRARVLANIAESRKARGSSKFRGHTIPSSEGGPSLFRGTSEGFESPTSARLGISPASTDPIVATVFARHSDNFGKGVLQIAGPDDLAGVDILEGNVLRALEREVGVGLKPSDFTARASTTVTSGQAVDALKKIGISVPRVGRAPGAVQSALENTSRLSNDQIRHFLEIIRRQ